MPTILSCSRLSFGVPLEDAFPPGEIHIGLKNLIGESYIQIAKSSYNVEVILSKFQGSVQERLRLKERLITRKEFSGLQTAPGAFLWVIRHFVGLLPVPLAPSHTNGKDYDWKNLSHMCKQMLLNYVSRGQSNSKLLQWVTRELLRLPPPNFLLFATLLNHLRMLAVLPEGEPRINKSATFALVKYFSSSIFLRPFRPGCVKKADKEFFPLLLYAVVRWPQIRDLCIKTSKYSFKLPLEELYSGFYNTSQPPECPYYLSKRSANASTQTAVHDPVKAVNSEHADTLIRIVPPSYDDFSFLRDTGCQTEGAESVICSKNFSRSNKKHEQTRIIFLKRGCCCTYATNYETTTDTQDVESDANKKIDKATNGFYDYGWNFNGIFDSSVKPDDNSLNSQISESASFSYDDYSKFDLVCDDTEDAYEKVKGFDPVEKGEKHTLNEAIKEKFSKIGWSYSSTPLKDECLSAETDRLMNYCSRTQGDNYKICYDACTPLPFHAELKKKLRKMRINEGFQENFAKTQGSDESSTPSVSKTHVSRKHTESKKSLINVEKIRSRLDFIGIFSVKKGKPKKCRSCEHIDSSVKYEKMESFSSIL